MERVLQLMEAWGYPRSGTDWLRRRRLLAIVVMALLSWALFGIVVLGIHFLSQEFASLVADLSDYSEHVIQAPSATHR